MSVKTLRDPDSHSPARLAGRVYRHIEHLPSDFGKRLMEVGARHQEPRVQSEALRRQPWPKHAKGRKHTR